MGLFPIWKHRSYPPSVCVVRACMTRSLRCWGREEDVPSLYAFTMDKRFFWLSRNNWSSLFNDGDKNLRSFFSRACAHYGAEPLSLSSVVPCMIREALLCSSRTNEPAGHEAQSCNNSSAKKRPLHWGQPDHFVKDEWTNFVSTFAPS